MKTGGTTDGFRVLFFFKGWGLWKCSEINCGEGCDSVNIWKTTEIYIINRWIVCYVKYILRNLLDFFIVDFSMMEELKHFFLTFSHFVYSIVNGSFMFFVLVVLFLLLLKIHSESTWTSVFLSTLFSAGKYCRWHASSQKRRPVLKLLTV